MPEPKRAVLISFECEGSTVRVSLDDIVQHPTDAKLWVQDRHVTSQVYPITTFEETTFSERQLADIGHYTLARLRAAKKVWVPND